MSLTLLTSILLIGCQTGPSDVVVRVEVPTQYEYSKEFQKKANEEIALLKRACQRDEVAQECSALRRLINDYGTVREESRQATLKKIEETVEEIKEKVTE